jgi:hypothetical protein
VSRHGSGAARPGGDRSRRASRTERDPGGVSGWLRLPGIRRDRGLQLTGPTAISWGWIMGASGAVLAVTASQLGTGTPPGRWLAVAAGVAVGLVPLARRGATQQHLTDWTRARSVSEALKRARSTPTSQAVAAATSNLPVSRLSRPSHNASKTSSTRSVSSPRCAAASAPTAVRCPTSTASTPTSTCASTRRSTATTAPRCPVRLATATATTAPRCPVRLATATAAGDRTSTGGRGGRPRGAGRHRQRRRRRRLGRGR